MPSESFDDFCERHVTSMESQYRAWLLECVYERGWSTLKCARELKCDPQQVLADFERYAEERAE